MPQTGECVTVTDAIDQADRSGGEASPALVAAGLEDGAAGTRAHAGAEAVLAVPASVVGLECALHDDLFRTFRAEFRKVTPTSHPNQGDHVESRTDPTMLRPDRRDSQPPRQVRQPESTCRWSPCLLLLRESNSNVTPTTYPASSPPPIQHRPNYPPTRSANNTNVICPQVLTFSIIPGQSLISAKFGCGF